MYSASKIWADSYTLVEEKLSLSRALPVTPDWSATPAFLDMIASYCLAKKPETIVECSSGTSSLVLSRCAQLNQNGHVYSLENGQPYAQATERHIEAFGLSDWQTTLLSPLVDTSIYNESFQWYSLEQLHRVLPVGSAQIDLLVIDGPPGFIQPLSRYPALPCLSGYLTDSTVIFLDDAARDDEKKLVSRWLKEFPAFREEYHDVPRGCVVLAAPESR